MPRNFRTICAFESGHELKTLEGKHLPVRTKRSNRRNVQIKKFTISLNFSESICLILRPLSCHQRWKAFERRIDDLKTSRLLSEEKQRQIRSSVHNSLFIIGCKGYVAMWRSYTRTTEISNTCGISTVNNAHQLYPRSWIHLAWLEWLPIDGKKFTIKEKNSSVLLITFHEETLRREFWNSKKYLHFWKVEWLK